MDQPLAIVIEDDSKLIDIFAQALETAGFSTQVFQDGNVASSALNSVEPALVLLDLHLPNLFGGKLLQQIRADKRLDSTRVMLATADPHSAEFLRDEADLVLIKPISFSQLRDLAIRLKPGS